MRATPIVIDADAATGKALDGIGWEMGVVGKMGHVYRAAVCDFPVKAMGPFRMTANF